MMKSLLGGFSIALLQLTFALVLSPEEGIEERYRRLYQWDSAWYGSIVDHGYVSTIPPTAQNGAKSNVAFFPAYPWFSSQVCRLMGWDREISQLVSAQLFAWFFWSALLGLLRTWKIPSGMGFLVVFSILAHPASFFLVSGYAESLFLLALLGFAWGCSWSSPRRTCVSAFSGLVLALSRVSGIPCAIVPLVGHWLRKERAQSALSPALIAVTTMSGPTLFFIYCQWKWGRWDLYFWTQKIGWNAVANYGAFLDSAIYSWKIPRNSTEIGQVMVPLSVLFFFLSFFLEIFLGIRSNASRWRVRLPFYLCAFLIFCISVFGTKNSGFVSMVRYHLSVFVPWVLATVHLAAEAMERCGLPKSMRRFFYASLISICVMSLGLQLSLLTQFLRGRWIG